jgi:hypothetical protein
MGSCGHAPPLVRSVAFRHPFKAFANAFSPSHNRRAGVAIFRRAISKFREQEGFKVMRRGTVFTLSLGSLLAACHPPDQAIYDESKSCVGIFDVAIKQIPPGDMRKAGLYSDVVNQTSLEAYEGALQSGAKLGLTTKAISDEVNQAKARAWKTYGATVDARSSATLLNVVKRCMPKPAGPND